MAEGQEEVHSIEIIQGDVAALKQKLHNDFAQMESVFLKAKALSEEWLDTQRRLQSEEKEVDPETLLGHPNVQREEMEATLRAELSHALLDVKEKVATVAKLREEVAMLEQKVGAACQEMVQSAARLEEGAHSARLALEATLEHLHRQATQKLPGAEQTEEEGGSHMPPPQRAAIQRIHLGPQEPPFQDKLGPVQDSQST